jgi:hypothetical protein
VPRGYVRSVAASLTVLAATPEARHSEREALRDPRRGYVALRGLASDSDVAAYLAGCEHRLAAGPVVHARITAPRVPDYVHPRSLSAQGQTIRVYQFLGNNRGTLVGDFLERALGIRDELEAPWMESDAGYRSELERRMDYTNATFFDGAATLPRHRDYNGDLPFPMLQVWTPLTEPGGDYTRGNLILHPRRGPPVRVEDEIGVKPGDLLVFDRSLDHEVEAPGPGTGADRGRWTTLIGARAVPVPRWRARLEWVAYGRGYPALQLARRLKRRPRGRPVVSP